MQIVDDYLALVALEGRRMPEWGDETPLVAWVAHARLLRALADEAAAGSLSAVAFDGANEAAANPPEEVLGVLDPRPYTVLAARMMRTHRLSLLGATMISAAIQHGAGVHFARKNFVESWYDAVSGTGARIYTYEIGDLWGSG